MKWGRLLLIILLAIYILFIYGDVFSNLSNGYINIIKYIGIILCFILSLIRNSKEDIVDAKLLQIGLFFTTFADLALVIFDSHVIGVILFTIVQLFYIARYTRVKFKIVLRKLLIVLVIIFSSYLLISKFMIKSNFIIIPIGLFYAVCLITGLVKGISISRDRFYLNPNKYMIALGMSLFALCDMSIAISYVLRMFNIFNISYLFSELIWIFYLPSQVLLALSGYERIK